MATLKTWIIGIANTEADGVRVYRVSGTKAQVKAYLANLVKEAKEADRESFDYGSTSSKEVIEERDGSLNAYAMFSDYHIDFTAAPEAAPISLARKGKEIKVSGITLLTKEEAKALPREQRANIGKPWWLRSPGLYQNSAAIVDYDGALFYYNVTYSSVGVRPALNLESSLKIGDRIEMAGYTWTAISENKVLCDTIVDRSCFRENVNASNADDYETSDIKAWLEKWAKEKGVV